MLRQMLYVQWRWNRDFLAFFVFAGVAFPLLLYAIVLTEVDIMTGGRMVGLTQLIFSLLAGTIVAAQGYTMDDRGGHVYALSVPCTRARFLATRSATAFLLLGLPALGVWIGGLIIVAQLDVPPMLQSYAGSLAIRSLLAAWLAHSVVFALRYAAGRRTAHVLGALIAVVTVFVLVPATRETLFSVGNFIMSHPGPLGIVFGRWTLIDV